MLASLIFQNCEVTFSKENDVFDLQVQARNIENSVGFMDMFCVDLIQKKLPYHNTRNYHIIFLKLGIFQINLLMI